jgi:uncharacterized membrane protein YhaH (DUF805 family)
LEATSLNLPALLFSFQGRLNRAPYWLAGMGVILAAVVLGNIALTIVGRHSAAAGVGVGLVFLLVVWVTLALTAKRLHDRDKSAWWLLLFYVVPSVLDAIGRLLGWVLILDPIGAAIGIWALVELGFLRGTKGVNNYGPDPLLAQAAA